MSPENNESKEPIEDQVKKVLSGMSGDLGSFLSGQPGKPASKTKGPESYGELLSVTLSYLCNSCSNPHYIGLGPEGFIQLFLSEKPTAYFDNFQVGIEAAKYRDQEWAKLEELMAQCDNQAKALTESQKHLTKVQALADDVTIRNSHLQVEVDVLRRELERAKAEGYGHGQTDTALDFPPATRRFNFFNAFKGFRLIGREGK